MNVKPGIKQFWALFLYPESRMISILINRWIGHRWQLIFVAIFVCCSSFNAQTNKKIGYANFNEILLQMKEYDSLNLEYNQYVHSFEEEIKSLSNVLRAKSEQMDTIQNAYRIQKLKQEHQELTAMLTELKGTAKSKSKTKREVLFKNLYEQMSNAKDKIIQDYGYDYIYDSGKTKIPPILNAEDVTNKLKEELGI